MQSAKVAEGGVSPDVRLKMAPPLPKPPKAEPSTGSVGKQVGIVVVAALLVVVSLFVITSISKQPSGATQQPGDPVPFVSEGPLPDQFAAREKALRAELDAATSVEDQERIRRSLIDVYLSAARLDLAGQETREVAILTGAERDWIASGNMFYDWMETKPVAERSPWAVQAIASYGEALAINPDNNDVRTDMAIAYMYDPQNPMLAIQETNAVLARDSLHIQANFNRGIMLMQINRLDQAREQFERVKTLVGDTENPVYQRAVEALTRLDNPGQ